MVEIHKIICKTELFNGYNLVIFSKNKEYKCHTTDREYRIYDQKDVAHLFSESEFKQWFFTKQEQRKLKLEKINK
jgi:hypothetical protein